jgi:hypothetical protein
MNLIYVFSHDELSDRRARHFYRARLGTGIFFTQRPDDHMQCGRRIGTAGIACRPDDGYVFVYFTQAFDL